MEKKQKTPKPITDTERHHLRAAEGWLELGNTAEAQREMVNIGKEFQLDSNVLSVWCEIHANDGKWAQCRTVARKLTKHHPECLKGWIYLANATRRVPKGSVRQAEKILNSIYMKFLFCPIISYTRALCAGQRGDFELAEDMLDDAFTCATQNGRVIDELAEMALKEPELQPIWHKIRPLAEFNKTH